VSITCNRPSARRMHGDTHSGHARGKTTSRPSGSVAREAAPAYEPGAPRAVKEVRDVIEGMVTSVAAAVAIQHDELADPELQATIATVQRSYDQLAMLRASLVATLQTRVAARAPAGRPLAGEREGTRFLRDELNLTPGDAKQTSEAAKELQHHDRTRRAWQDGQLSQGHASVIGRALRQVPEEHRDSLEVELLEAATRTDAVALGRLARRRVGEYAPAQAERSERQRHLFRRASVRQNEQGDVVVSGTFSGTQGETIMASWRAFYDKPTGKDTRTHEQRAADAVEAMALAALRVGEAPTQHGERPHVIVVVRQEDLLRGSGMAHLGHTGSVPVATIGHLLRDSVMTHVGVDSENAPIAVTSRVRSVPRGLWRALIVRDGGCTWEGCTAPIGWCDVAHGEHPYELDGRLSPSNSALLCRTHHRRFDHGKWTIEVQGDKVTYRHSNDPPVVDSDSGGLSTGGPPGDGPGLGPPSSGPGNGGPSPAGSLPNGSLRNSPSATDDARLF
jgi:hypothetical protein